MSVKRTFGTNTYKLVADVTSL